MTQDLKPYDVEGLVNETERFLWDLGWLFSAIFATCWALLLLLYLSIGTISLRLPSVLIRWGVVWFLCSAQMQDFWHLPGIFLHIWRELVFTPFLEFFSCERLNVSRISFLSWIQIEFPKELNTKKGFRIALEDYFPPSARFSGWLTWLRKCANHFLWLLAGPIDLQSSWKTARSPSICWWLASDLTDKEQYCRIHTAAYRTRPTLF